MSDSRGVEERTTLVADLGKEWENLRTRSRDCSRRQSGENDKMKKRQI